MVLECNDRQIHAEIVGDGGRGRVVVVVVVVVVVPWYRGGGLVVWWFGCVVDPCNLRK